MANGSIELAALAARLRVAGDKGLRLQLLRGLRKGAKPLIPAVTEAALRQLPKGGGLNEQVASQTVKVTVRLTASAADVRLTTTAPDTFQTDHGFVRHPLWGRRSKGQWRTQQIPQATGWWSQTLAEKSPEVTEDLLAVMKEVAIAIEGGM